MPHRSSRTDSRRRRRTARGTHLRHLRRRTVFGRDRRAHRGRGRRRHREARFDVDVGMGVGVGMGDVDAEDDVIDRSMGDTRRTLFA